VLRRFETYTFLPGVPTEQRQRLAEVLVDAGRHIPEVLGSAVGWNRSAASSDLVWEHYFDSPLSYQRYMVHPYHADLIDRYVLADSPERLVETVRGAGLFGYRCDDASLGERPRRLVVLLDVDPEAGDAAARRLWDRLAAAAEPDAAISFGPNSLANSWFDGVTPLPGPPPRWNHVWEAGMAADAGPDLEPDLEAVLDSAPVRGHRQLRYDVLR
jgi:hypothetical protein